MLEENYASPYQLSHSKRTAIEEKRPFKIICRGKLPNSSYYDVVNQAQSIQTDSLSANLLNYEQSHPMNGLNGNQPHIVPVQNVNINNLNNENNEEESTNGANFTDSNTEIWSCVFSADNTHLAWSCGYGIIKLMRWSDSKFRKRTVSEHDNSSPQSQSPPKPPSINGHQRNKNEPNHNDSLNTSSLQLNSCDEIAEIDCGEMVRSLAFGSPQKSGNSANRSRVYTRFNLSEYKLLLAVGLVSGKIRIYDAITGKFLLILFDHKDLVTSLKFSKDGTLQLASASRDETIKLWNMNDDGNMYKTLKGHVSWINAIDWSPVAPMLCSVGVNRQAFVWDTKTFTIRHRLNGHLHDVVSCEFSPDGALLATASYDTKIFLWDPYSGRPIRVFYHVLPPPRFIYAGGHNGSYVTSLAFSSYGDHLVSICDDKKIRIWSVCTRNAEAIAEGAHNDALCCAYSTSTRAIMAGTKHGQVDVYETPLIIQRLKHLCRVVVNKQMDRDGIRRLHLPNELKKYLNYEDIMDKCV